MVRRAQLHVVQRIKVCKAESIQWTKRKGKIKFIRKWRYNVGLVVKGEGREG